MKTKIFFLIIIHIFIINLIVPLGNPVPIYAQWVIQNDPQSNNLLYVKFVNRNTGWSCGDGGAIIKTTNGGTNWFTQNSGTSNRLESICPVDSQYVYCVGWWNTILKTTNGGINWLIIRNGVSSSGISFYGLYFLNRNTGWLLRNNYILRTTNGGNTFDSTYEVFSYMRDVFFKDPLNGILCGDGALILKSTDGGVIWNEIAIPHYNNGYPDFYKESFIENTGWVVGAGTDFNLGNLCWKTTNFGSTWDSISRVPYPNGVANYCIHFSNLNTGWCGGTNGYIFKTTNGGFNWYEQVVPTTYFRNSIWFYNDSIGWAVGGGAQILFTTSSGQYVKIEKISENVPSSFKLYQNYPNPFNPITEIKYGLPKDANVVIKVYDLLGKEVTTLVNDFKIAGYYNVLFDDTNLASGVYFYRIKAGNFISVKKMVILK